MLEVTSSLVTPYSLFLQLYLGTGKGGTSIWGRKFEDEYSEHLKVSNCLTKKCSFASHTLSLLLFPFISA